MEDIKTESSQDITVEAQQNLYEQEIYLTKKDGIWKIEMYKDGIWQIDKTVEAKELVIAMIDVENPFAITFVDGPILGRKFNGFHMSMKPDKEFKHHECFESNEQAILDVLKNDGLVLAFSPESPPPTENFYKYVEENNITLPEELKLKI